MTLASTLNPVALDPAAIAVLRGRLRGQALTPDDPRYDSARAVWNGMINKRPALIVRPADRLDIQRSVHFAREHELPVSIKGGGHNVAGHAVTEGGLMLDLGLMREVAVDPITNRALVQGGALWSDVDKATSEHGLAAPGGVISSTGVAGLTLGGGIGWLVGKHGLSIDNLLSVSMVTANSEVISVNRDRHPDLFWAIRGGGGNFGVVTSFEFALHPVSNVLAGAVVWPVSEANKVLAFYREFTATAPDELACYAQIATDPESGARIVAIAICWTGDIAEGERIVAPIRAFNEPVADLIGTMPFDAWQQAFDADFPHGRRYFWKGNLVRELTDEALAGMAEFGANPPSAQSTVVIEWYRGVMNRVDSAATAFAHRDAEYQIVCIGAWDDEAMDADGMAWTREIHQATGAGALNGGFLNFNSVDAGSDPRARVRASYGDNWERLVEIKRQYDPDNLFSENNNIAP